MLGIQRKYWNKFLSAICKKIFSITSTTWSAAATSPKLQSKSLERISPVVKLYRLILGAIFLGKNCYLLVGVLLLKMLYLCQIQVARSPRLWKHVGSPFASLVMLDQSRSVSRSRAIGHCWWRDHPKLCKPASMQILSGTSRPRWWCHLLQSWLVWGAPCLLCCPAAPSAPPSALSLVHPEWKVAKETREKNEFTKKMLFAWIGCHSCRT